MEHRDVQPRVVFSSKEKAKSPIAVPFSQTEEVFPKFSPLRLSWHNITVTHRKTDRTILEDVSGVVRPGRLLALMGASGAGKTTLLNTLIDRNLTVSLLDKTTKLKDLQVDGTVLVDGKPMGRREITRISGYVQQEELFLPTLTVKEHLLIQARLRLVGMSEERRHKKVDEIMADLGLLKCRHSRIGENGLKKGISGGESKRLSFASELLSDPPLLFCDEPTTGLDSAMTESVVQTMKILAERGHTIICTIHQPSSYVYGLFHQVMFLAGGHIAYYGSPLESVPIFERFGCTFLLDHNPADVIIETLAIEQSNEEECRERVTKICEQFRESNEGKAFSDEINVAKSLSHDDISAHIARPTPNFFVQFSVLLKRFMMDNLRNPAVVRAKLVYRIFMGIYIGLLYFQISSRKHYVENMNGAIYFLLNELTHATTGILSFLPHDYPLIVREYHDGLYHLISYYTARCLSYVPLFSIDGLIMMSIAYFMVGFAHETTSFLGMLGISLLIEQSAAGFGVMLSSCTPSYPIAVSIAAPIVAVMALTGGMYANVGKIPSYIGWIQYCSWFRYGFESFLTTQWSGVEAENAEKCAMINHTSHHCSKAEDVLANLSFSTSNLARNVSMLAALIITFYSIGFIGLWIRINRSR